MLDKRMQGHRIDKRILWGCIAALGTMLLCGLVVHLFDAQLNRAVDTGLGSVSPFDLLSILLAMTVGGAIAGRRFRWIALALMGAVWLATLGTLALVATPSSPAAMTSLPAMLKYNALAIGLSLGAAWLGAWLGERWGARRVRQVTQA